MTKFELITNKEKCNALYSAFEFKYFKTSESIYESDHTFESTEFRGFFEKYLIQNSTLIDKKDRQFLIFNRTGNGKTLEDFYLPQVVMVDFDHLTKEQTIEIYDKVKSLPTTFYCDYSQSGTGVKALMGVYNNMTVDFYMKNIKNFTIGVDMYLAKDMQRQNFDIIKQYLGENNIDVAYYNIDECGARLQQGCFSSNGVGFYFNSEPNFIYYEYQPSTISKSLINRLSNDQNLEANKKYLHDFHSLINTITDVNEKLFIDALFKKFTHYHKFYPFLNALKYIEDKAVLTFFYNVIRHAYQGREILNQLNSYDNFLNYIRNFNGLNKYVIDVSRFLADLEIYFNRSKFDLFYNAYDKTIIYESYLAEKKDELFEIFDYNPVTVLKSIAGSGKTSLMHTYIKGMFDAGCTKIVLCIPKNSLNTQQFEILTDKFYKEDFTIIKNYGNNNYKPTGGKELIISSMPKLYKIVNSDLLIIDEIQNLVFYSDKINSTITIDFSKLILISATPEPYLIGMNSKYYINCQNNSIKRDISILYKAHRRMVFDKYVDKKRKQMFFVNDITFGEEMKELFKGEVDFVLLNKDSFNKNKNICEILKYQYLPDSHYIVTSYISDGINFNNEDWDDLIIIETQTMTICEIYQLPNRFRKAKNLNIILSARIRNDLYTGKPLDYKYINNISEKSLASLAIIEQSVNEFNNGLQTNSLSNIEGLININGKYTFGECFLKLQKFTIYNHIFKNDSRTFHQDIEYYFNIKEEIINDIKYCKKNYQKELNQFVKSHIDYIVENIYALKRDCSDPSKVINFNDSFLFPVNTVYKFILENPEYFYKIICRIEQLVKNNGNPIHCLLKRGFTAKINGLKCKRLLNTNIDQIKEAPDKLNHEWLNQFLEWILKQDIFKKVKDYTYFLMDDLIEAIVKNSNGEKFNNRMFLPNINQTVIGIKLKLYEEHFEHTKIYIDGKRTYVYLVK